MTNESTFCNHVSVSVLNLFAEMFPILEEHGVL